ncbi:hypothetical protein [Frigidibacter oleivorans]|uniref:hypothetical protein n=1 Tax=Frigidibacter oleivorans TaxID=2487129 RepID=UPI001F48AB31|nr:hypothetical protein [Frigidibacter oleivorans]
MTTILLLGSGPGVTACRDWPRAPFDRIAAINNAWAVRPDWDLLIHPWDFAPERMPADPPPGARIVTEADFVPAQNAFGGFVYAGATMAFTAAYWLLAEYRPRRIAFLGCDMHYPADGPTHFYGRGSADPLRPDITLQSLEAKATRLAILAARQGCTLVNLSAGPSRLTFPRATPATLDAVAPPVADAAAVAAALAREAELAYFVPSGRYWEDLGRFDPAALAALDALWLAALPGVRNIANDAIPAALAGEALPPGPVAQPGALAG